MKKISRIGVFTSGGDSPGMNACIRAVVRNALHHHIQVSGIRYGYQGMIDNDIIHMNASSVANIIQRGGTILKTARSKEFMEVSGREKAIKNLKEHHIDALVAIGGDGTFKGAIALNKMCNIPVIGCPGTIDNDLAGTDFTIGYDTAINTVVENVDRIRDTAESHNRVFIVEVMGRDAGLIALRSGIGSGAEAILIPETHTDLETLLNQLRQGRKTKSSKIIMVAEGDEAGGAFKIGEFLKKNLPETDIRITVLGHLQRGGNPSCMDRVNASMMGFDAVNALLAGHSGEMIGIVNGKVKHTPFEKAVKHIDKLDHHYLEMLKILSR